MKISLIKTQRILSPTQISIADFTINPYRGCPYGCIYCYAQENKAIKKKNLAWGSFVDIKVNAVDLLKKELKNKKIKRVLLGSTVECYPPQENEFCLTQRIIELLNQNDIAVTILTKSCLLERDLDLISKNKMNKVYLTINFDNEDTKNLFEPKTSRLIDRWNLLELMQKKQIPRRLYIAPYIPGIQNIPALINKANNLEEITVEIYNPLMGNWNALKKILETNYPADTFRKIDKIFSDENNYKGFVEEFSQELEKLGGKNKNNISLIVPNFKTYYSSQVAYE